MTVLFDFFIILARASTKKSKGGNLFYGGLFWQGPKSLEAEDLETSQPPEATDLGSALEDFPIFFIE